MRLHCSLTRLMTVAVIALLASALSSYASAQDSSADPTTGRIDTTDNLQLFYRIDGSGPERIVVLHGGPGFNFTYLQPELAALAASYTVIYYDQRGGGSSSITSEPALLHVDKHVADLEAVRRHFAIDRLTLLGHSWGAGLAAQYAARYPGNVRRLILASPIPPRMAPYAEQFESNLFTWMDDATREEVERLAAAERDAVDPAAACRAFWAVFIRGYLADKEQPPALRGGPCDAPTAALRNAETVRMATMGSLGAWDWRPQLAAIDVPTLVVHGDSDPLPLESAREWASTLPNATLSVIERSGHFPFVERPQPFFEAVLGFLDTETGAR